MKRTSAGIFTTCFVKKTGLLISGLLCISCNNDPGTAVPEIEIGNYVYQIHEDALSGSVSLPVSLSWAFDSDVTVEYATTDSTAVAGSDYTSVTSGKLIFKPGEVTKNISVNIIRNPIKTEDLYFTLRFKNPENGKLSRSKMVVKIIDTDYTDLVWGEEFISGPLNTADWNYELGAGGWGNNELETYTNSTDNVKVENGYLYITALNPSAGYYTSGRITTKGKREFANCRVEIRARLTEGKGIWPALWMLGGNISTVGWPKCGEIDIMENIGHLPSVSYGTLHWDSEGHKYMGGSYTLPSGKFISDFHVFTVDWTPNNITWYVDGQQFYKINAITASGFPFTLPQFFIFNVAVGGNWPGNPDQTTVFPQQMVIDYIRVYQ